MPLSSALATKTGLLTATSLSLGSLQITVGDALAVQRIRVGASSDTVTDKMHDSNSYGGVTVTNRLEELFGE